MYLSISGLFTLKFMNILYSVVQPICQPCFYTGLTLSFFISGGQILLTGVLTLCGPCRGARMLGDNRIVTLLLGRGQEEGEPQINVLIFYYQFHSPRSKNFRRGYCLGKSKQGSDFLISYISATQYRSYFKLWFLLDQII